MKFQIWEEFILFEVESLRVNFKVYWAVSWYLVIWLTKFQKASERRLSNMYFCLLEFSEQNWIMSVVPWNSKDLWSLIDRWHYQKYSQNQFEQSPPTVTYLRTWGRKVFSYHYFTLQVHLVEFQYLHLLSRELYVRCSYSAEVQIVISGQ